MERGEGSCTLRCAVLRCGVVCWWLLCCSLAPYSRCRPLRAEGSFACVTHALVERGIAQRLGRAPRAKAATDRHNLVLLPVGSSTTPACGILTDMVRVSIRGLYHESCSTTDPISLHDVPHHTCWGWDCLITGSEGGQCFATWQYVLMCAS
jgi:hypothetical protein